MGDYLTEIEATSRRLAAGMKRAGGTEQEALDLCVNCQERWTLPADRNACAHESPVCDDCWPNGCPHCEAQVEEDLRRREEITRRILSAVLEVRTTADDLAESDLAALGWLVRNDVRKHVGLAIESLRRVADVMDSQTRDAELKTGRARG